MVLPVLLFACGLLFILLGWNKLTLLNADTHPNFNEGLSIAFFIYGLIQVSVALMALLAPQPFGSLIAENVTVVNNYGLVNETFFNYAANGTLVSTTNQTINLWQ